MNYFNKLLISILLVGLSFSMCSTAHAEFVRVSDLGFQKFVNQCNAAMSLSGQERINIGGEPISDDMYDSYLCGVGGRNSGVIAVFFVNKEGYVSKINLATKYQDSSVELNRKVLFACLNVIGLTTDEIQTLFQYGTELSTVWGSKINRRVIVEMSMEKNYGDPHVIIQINAYDS